MSRSANKLRAGAAVGLAALAVAATASAAPLGLECTLDMRSPPSCPAAGCAAADIKPYNETHWYLVDPARRTIEEYADTGADRGAPFRQPVITDRGEIRAEGGELGPGQTTVSLISLDPTTGRGGLSILVMPGGEFGHGQSYSLSGACSLRPAAYILSDKRPRPAG